MIKCNLYVKKYLHFQKKCAIVLLASENRLWYAPVAQLDRVTGYETQGRLVDILLTTE